MRTGAVRRTNHPAARRGRRLAALVGVASVALAACQPQVPVAPTGPTSATTTTAATATSTTTPPTTPTSTTTTTRPTGPGEPAAAGPVAGDGTTSSTAGASCWGIKQQFPSSPSGTYWLLTPAMDRPAAFACDMTTEGGGWVLVGRGRQGWTWSPNGQGGASAVRSATSGAAAFAPAALDNATITGLINGASPAALSDGIRVERATNVAGTTRQQVRLYPRFTAWSWKWDGAQLLNRVVIDGTSYSGSNTRDTYETAIAGQTTNRLAGQQGTKRLFTWAWEKNGNLMGFSYGKGAPPARRARLRTCGSARRRRTPSPSPASGCGRGWATPSPSRPSRPVATPPPPSPPA